MQSIKCLLPLTLFLPAVALAEGPETGEKIRKVSDQAVKYVMLENDQGHAMLGYNYWKGQGATIIAHVDAAHESDQPFQIRRTESLVQGTYGPMSYQIRLRGIGEQDRSHSLSDDTKRYGVPATAGGPVPPFNLQTEEHLKKRPLSTTIAEHFQLMA